MKPNIIIHERSERPNPQPVVQMLTRVLADENLLLVKTRNYHWNVRGPHFVSLHRLFDEQYGTLAETVDEVAERVRSIGGKAIGTLTEFLKYSSLTEEPGRFPNAPAMVRRLLEDHDRIIELLHKDLEECAVKYNDISTSDFLTALMQKHEKMSWMLRSILEE